MQENGRVRLVVLGLGNMGMVHIQNAAELGEITLYGVCDTDRVKADRVAAERHVKAYYDYREVAADPEVDAVLIATPHFDHTPAAIAAFSAGKHVLCEKPLAVHVNDGRKMIAAYEEAKKRRPDLVFALVFNQRTNGEWRKVKDLIDSGELGRLVRASWIITDWFRTQYYYDTGGWRASWKGEGGGVLLNQCPHNLDLFQWFFGMPDRVTAFAGIGKYHRIEVEDEVSAFLEYGNGMVGHFVTSTAESPGTNRLEIVGENGKLIYEDGKLTFFRNRVSMLEFLSTSDQAFAKVENWRCELPSAPDLGAHRGILENFASTISGTAELFAPGVEGIRGLELGNAMLLSALTKSSVELPIDGDRYERLLADFAEKSTFRKTVRREAKNDGFLNSF